MTRFATLSFPVKTAPRPDSPASLAVWALLAAASLLVAAGTIHAFRAEAPAKIDQAQRPAQVKWVSEKPLLARAKATAEPDIEIAGLRLRIDETTSFDPVSDAVNDADARLDSLIMRHDRLAEMIEDLHDDGIDFAVKIEDLVPIAMPALHVGKPRVLDTSEANARHPLFAFVRDIRDELSAALQEPPDAALARIGNANARLDTLAIRQFGTLDRIEKEVEGRHDRLASVPRALGIDLPERENGDAQGGPLVPLSGTSAVIYAFETRMEAVELTLARMSDIGRIVTRLPIRRPVSDASISSGYGPRVDPFLGKPAMHTGIDFRATKGTSVKAAGAGTILRAGRLGGYGNVVEIDHGQGLTSRYAHLSRIMVSPGDKVAPGDVIGKVGSTGRSTGPHLHFEVRRNGSARNPITYIHAGQKL